MASKLDMINRLAQRVPVVNEEATKQLEAGRNVQLQQSLGAAPAGLPAVRIAQTVAPQAAAQSGQIQTAAAAKTNQDLATVTSKSLDQAKVEQTATQSTQQLGQKVQQADASRQQGLDLSREDIKSQKLITSSEIDSARRLSTFGIEQDNRLINVSLKQRRELAAVGSDVKNQILDSRLQFSKDESGRKFSNDRQLMDYTISNAKSEIELRSRLRDMQQASDRKIQLMQTSAQKLVDAVNRGWLTREQKLDYNQKVYLLDLAKKMEAKIAKDKAGAANRLMVAQGIGTVAGGAVGGYATGGSPVGIMAGATIGSAVGGAVGGAIA